MSEQCDSQKEPQSDWQTKVASLIKKSNKPRSFLSKKQKQRLAKLESIKEWRRLLNQNRNVGVEKTCKIDFDFHTTYTFIIAYI